MKSFPQRARDFVRWRVRAGRHRMRDFRESVRGARRSRRFEAVDPRVRYPSYKSLDELVDVERLRALDRHVRAGVRRCFAKGLFTSFDTGGLKPLWKSRRPGARLIELTRSSRPFQYFDLSDPSLWEPTPAQDELPELMEFIATLPFAETARMVVICDDEGREVTRHRDHGITDALHEFVWFRTNLDKRFFVMDRRLRRKLHVRSYAAWFDTVNQFHGVDATDRPTISLRVDGRFTDELRARIPRPPFNAASTPAYWEAVEPSPIPA